MADTLAALRAYNWRHFLLATDGRISRSDYWLRFQLPATVLIILIAALDPTAGYITLVAALAIVWPYIAVGIKRAHDRNKSGWWLLITFVPAIGSIWYLVEFGILKGTEGPNRFGEDPLAA